MNRAIVVLLLLASTVAQAQPVITWRPPMNCATNDLLKWNGSAWVCGTAPLTGTGTNNRVTKWTSATTIGDTAFPIDDTATTLTVGNSTTADSTTISGNVLITAGAANALTSTFNGTGQTTDRIGGNFVNSGSYDTTAAQLIAYGLQSTCSATESAGGNTSICIGGLFTSSGLDDNRALQTNAGDVRLNVTGGALLTFGNSTLGDTNSDTHTLNGDVSVIEGSSGAAAAAAGTVLTVAQATGNHNYITMKGDENLGVVMNTTTQAQDGGLVYAATTDEMRIITSGTARQALNASGTVFMGDTASTGIADNIDVLTLGNAGTGQSTTAKALLLATNTGSYTTAGGNVTAYVGNFVTTATESAGGNVFTNVALRASAPTGDVPIGLWVDDGSTLIDGDTTAGDADTDFLNSRGTFAVSGTDPTINSCGSSPAISGESQSFQLTVGSGVTSCVVNLGRTFNSAPFCTFSPVNSQAAGDIAATGGNGDAPRVSASTTTTVTWSFDANTENGPIYNVTCVDRR